MKKILLSLLLCVAATCGFVADVPARANSNVAMLNATTDSRILVVLVGVDNYADPKIPRLSYCGADMKTLRDAFLLLGATTRDVVMLTDPRESLDGGFINENAPTKERIVRAIEDVAANAGPNDTIFVCLSGHGIRINVKDDRGAEKKVSCFCPQDVDRDDLENTTIPLPQIYQKLGESKARFKTVVVDACRNEIADGAKSVDGDAINADLGATIKDELPENVLLLTSCVGKQKSYEDSEFQHGVFTYYLTKALLRQAPELQQDETLYFTAFWLYVQSKTAERVQKTRHVLQTPHDYANMELGDFPIRNAKIEDQEPTFYENAIGMEFLKIPSGRKSLVSKKATETRTVRLTNHAPFYIGIYEVTEKEYRSILGLGAPDDEDDENVRRSRFPITNVSWEDAAAFVKRLNETIPPEGDALLGKGWRYDLPTIADWEYAFAYNLDETNLNDVYRNFDVYAQVKEDLDSTGRLAYVGLKRPIGQLFDMLGNANEWCYDGYSENPNQRATKGGSFDVPKVATEQAFSPQHTFYVDKDSREPTIGFRLVVRKNTVDKITRRIPERAKASDVKRPTLNDLKSIPQRGTSKRTGTNATKNVKTTILVNRSSDNTLKLFLKDPTEEPIGEYDELNIRPLSEYRMSQRKGTPERIYLYNDGKIYYYDLQKNSELLFDRDDQKWTVEAR